MRELLFQLSPEAAHGFALDGIRLLEQCKISSLLLRTPYLPVKIHDLDFPNPIGLAAGLDKDARCIRGFAALGFGFLEVGTVTPRPQPGNATPRLFRLPAEQALINRMGFNNAGVEAMVAAIRAADWPGILGINIGKNAATPANQAVDDYLFCLEHLYRYASYITVNVSSPNTKGLRDLQFGESFKSLLNQLKEKQQALTLQYGLKKPIFIKLAPDMDDDALIALADVLMAFEWDGVILTNTTISRHGVEHSALAAETGGLSGRPLTTMATHAVKVFHDYTGGCMPIIAVGGVMSPQDAVDKIEAGASLVQLYTGLIYQGPMLIHESVKAIQARRVKSDTALR